MIKTFALAAFLLCLHQSWGQAGASNTLFHGGSVTTSFSNSIAQAEDLVVQPDGKIVVAGLADVGGTLRFAVARYLTNGSLDDGFGINGKITTLIGSTSWGKAIALQPDGKIVVAGYATNGGSDDFAMARYNTDGSPDAGFGSNGQLITPISSGADVIYDIAIQPDGRIVAGGISNGGVNSDFALVRYLPNGLLDPSFSGGIVTLAVGVGDDYAKCLRLQNDGKILLAGHAFTGLGADFALVRFTASGQPDPSFGMGGKVTTSVGGSDDFGVGMALQADGKILVAGSSYSPANNWDIAVVRYTNEGFLDAEFGIEGRVITDIGNTFNDAVGVAVQQDGRIVVAGHTSNSLNEDFVLLRYHSNGMSDASFGSGGMSISDLSGSDDIAYSMQLAGTLIYVAGVSHNNPDQFALASFLNDATPLPVRLLAFQAEKQGTGISLQWQTSGEVNSDYFLVERSADGKSFTGLQKVMAAGNTDREKRYSALDRTPLTGANFYRLRSVDRNGSYSQSQVVVIRLQSEKGGLEVFPNPASSLVQLQLPDGLQGKVQVDLVEASGRKVRSFGLQLNGNALSMPLDLSNLARGLYILRASSATETFTRNLVKN